MSFGNESAVSALFSRVISSVSEFVTDESGTGARAMVFASVTAAGLIGLGIGAVALGMSTVSQSASVDATANTDISVALAAAMNPAADTVAEPVAISADETIEIGGLTSAMNAALQNTGDVTPVVNTASVITADVWLQPLRDNWEVINRAARENLTVNALNNVLPAFDEALVVVRSGDTMMNLLTDMGIDRQEAYYAIEAFGEVFDPRRLRVGHEFNVAYETLDPIEQGSAEDQLRLLNISLRTAPDQEVIVHWDEESEDYLSEARAIELEDHFTRAHGRIDSSLYMAANDLGVPDAMTIGMIRIFSHSIDFQRDIRTGDEFEVYYSQRFDESGEAVMNGDIVYASMTTRGRTQNLYRFTTPDDGLTDYFNEAGESVRAFLMRTPIDGARITSNFGARRHPVLGYNRMHKGVDFGAPTGTPIYAAGSGTVVRSSRFGSYGNYVRIRHVNGYETAYAHLNGYGPGIRSGVRVEQGQIIGYVGATGRVTGAHLHYEVLLNDEQVNPRTIDLPSGRQLEGDVLTAFQTQRGLINTQMADANMLSMTASASVGGSADINPDLAAE